MPKSKQYNNIQIGSMRLSVRSVLTALVSAVVFFALVYVYLLASTTMNITMKKTLKNDSYKLQSEIADLEADYLVGRSALTLLEARDRGFQEAQKQAFVYRYKNADSLALGLE